MGSAARLPTAIASCGPTVACREVRREARRGGVRPHCARRGGCSTVLLVLCCWRVTVRGGWRGLMTPVVVGMSVAGGLLRAHCTAASGAPRCAARCTAWPTAQRQRG
eukprot:7385356-Prymnesium_polylepis.1